MDPNVRYYQISDEVWDAGYWELRDTTVPGYPIFKWPLPKHRVYEVVEVGSVWHVMRRGSDCTVAGVREGEGSTCEKCGGAYTTAKCPACMRFGGES